MTIKNSYVVLCGSRPEFVLWSMDYLMEHEVKPTYHNHVTCRMLIGSDEFLYIGSGVKIKSRRDFHLIKGPNWRKQKDIEQIIDRFIDNRIYLGSRTD